MYIVLASSALIKQWNPIEFYHKMDEYIQQKSTVSNLLEKETITKLDDAKGLDASFSIVIARINKDVRPDWTKGKKKRSIKRYTNATKATKTQTIQFRVHGSKFRK